MAVTQKSGHDRERRSPHDGVTGIGVPEIVEADVLETGFLPDDVPSTEHIAERLSHVLRRRKQIIRFSRHASFDDRPSFGVQVHGPWSGLAVAKPKTGSGHLVPMQADDFAFATAGQQEKADNVDLLMLRRCGPLGIGMTVKSVVESTEFLPRKKTGELLPRVGPDLSGRVCRDMPAGDRMVEDMAKGLQTVVGVARSGSAVVVEPSENHCGRDTVKSQAAKLGKQMLLEVPGSPSDCHRLAPVDPGGPPWTGGEAPEERNVLFLRDAV